MSVVLRPYQTDLIARTYQAYQAGARNALCVLPTGGGKCLGRDTPVLMFDGTVKMSQDVIAGDRLIGPDSRPRTVITTTSGVDQLYRVIPTKGDPYVVNSKHLLSLRRTSEKGEPMYPCQRRAGEIVNIPICEYIDKPKWFKHIHKGWRAPVDFDPVTDLNIEPYMLGLWLGDGTRRTTAITTADWEIVLFLIEHAKRHNLRLRYELKPENRAFSVFSMNEKLSDGRSDLHKSIIAYGLHREKHIPYDFKRGSVRDRLELLAGIIDTDGHYTGKGYDIVQKNERLLDDIIFVARSLGFSAYKSPCRKTCVNNGAIGDYYRCNISGDIDTIPVKIPRKRAAPRKQKKNVLNVGLSVESIGVGEFFGFQVDGPDHLFLLGDFTVTHNSVIVSQIILDGHQQGLSECVIAHRNELVGQMSLHVARRGIPHRIIASKSAVAQITAEHRREFGRSLVNPDARCSVVSVDTLNARRDQLMGWAAQVQRWTIDEAHHVLRANKWGKAVTMFPNAYGLGVTATAVRADGMGLGAHHDGVFEDMIAGPSMRDLIDIGALSDYEIAVPESDFHIEDDTLAPSGDWSSKRMREASKRSHIVGDVVIEYQRRAPGKRAICFATDVETAGEMAARFNEAGVMAAAVSAKTPTETRNEYIRRFRDGRLTMLVNVDLFGEGFDVPAVEVVIMARPTASLAVYLQQFGRALRPMAGKPYGLVIDHVSNWKRHGFPDKQHIWTLDRREKRAKQEPDPEDIPLTACRACSRPYERALPACPYCGNEPPAPEGGARSIDQVDGDLMLLDRARLAELRAAMQLETPAALAARVGHVAGELAARGAVNRLMERHAAQTRLREAIEQWAGVRRAKGDEDRTIHRRFYLTLGVDVLSAMAGSRAEMESLAQRIEGWYS